MSPMNRINQQQLDRLVDGELGDGERKRLIESLDQHPDGWRQCACAFLEAQELKWALSIDVEPTRSSDLPAVVMTPDELTVTRKDTLPGTRKSSTIRWWAALASCLVVGFGIGQLGFRGDSGGDSAGPPLMIVGNATDNGLSTQSGQLLASDDRGVDSTSSLADESILERQYSMVPADIEDIFARLGQRVERRQVYMPVASQNGERRSVPMEEIEIVPVRWETY